MTLKELQDKLYDSLCLVDDICKKEGVKYFLDGGTLIGSVREKDIIPWDDDIDIKVLREDYDAFKAAMLKHLPEHYKFVEPEEFSPYFYDFIPRVIDTTQHIRKVTDEDEAYKNYQNYIGMDVFIIDNAPSGALARKMMMLKIKILYGMAMSKRYKLHKEKYSFTEKVVAGTCMFFGKFMSLENIFKKWNKTITKHKDKKCEWVIPASFALMFLDFFKYEWYESTVEGELRGRKFPIPVGYHEELTQIYGDYMQPPKDKSIYISHFNEEEENKE